jgi:hypothetical protein
MIFGTIRYQLDPDPGGKFNAHGYGSRRSILCESESTPDPNPDMELK